MPQKYLDFNGASPRLQFPETFKISKSRMRETPEGFLYCEDVPLARTGEMIYRGYEVPLEPGADGLVRVERGEDEVFHPDAISSFAGKPFTDDHPYEDVSPKNYKQHLIGVVQNPRRGEGEYANHLIGDLVVYDPATIRKIKSGKREISCGYDADYRRIAAGHGKQINIRGNHVSLVDEGRCGPTCAIKDRRTRDMKTARKSTWVDHLIKAIRSKDSPDEMEEHLGKMAASVPETKPPEGSESEGGDNHHHVTVNIGGQGAEKGTASKDEEGAAGENAEGVACTKQDVADAIAAALGPLLAQLKDTQDKLKAMEDAMDDMTDPDDMATQDAVARAEVLRPGIKLPTIDAKPGSRQARDAISSFQKQVLIEAYRTTDGKAAIDAISGGRPDFGRMTPGEIGLLFRGASQHVYDCNCRNSASELVSATAGYVRDEAGARKILDNRTWNEQKNKFYGRAS